MQGQSAPFVAFAWWRLIGFVAIAVDGGVLLDRRQTLQAAADAAALAAAQDLYANYLTNQGQDQNGTALQAALDNASDNGYPSGNVTVNIPPTSGPFKDLVGYAEVIVTYDQQRYFSALFGKSKIQLTARAVAQGRAYATKAGIIILHPTASGALTMNGGGTVTVVGVPIIIDSNAPTRAWPKEAERRVLRNSISWACLAPAAAVIGMAQSRTDSSRFPIRLPICLSLTLIRCT